MIGQRDAMVEFDRAECFEHLGGRGVGRLAATIGALPTIFPVSYAVLDGDVVFRAATGSKLASAVRDTVVAFQVDDADRFSHNGWSIVVVGRACEITDPVEIALAEHLPLTMGPGDRGAGAFVRLRADLVSGQRFV